MRWQEEVFGPMLERTMENAQVLHLAEHYDLSRDSRLARAIVRFTNDTLDAEEHRRQVVRVRPGELFLETGRGPLNVILPCPGTVLDMGRMLTHKELVVRLHLQGLSVLEIARRTYHSPRSVDAYLKSFDSVLILHLYGLPPKLMAAVLGRGQALVHEYLDLIGKYLKDLSAIREHLRRRGLHIPANVSHAG